MLFKEKTLAAKKNTCYTGSKSEQVTRCEVSVMSLGIKRTLLYEEVVMELYRMIDQGQVKLGEQFPSERELVEQLNISRNVLREAFHVLEDRGLVISQQGKGRFLRALPDPNTLSKDESLSKNLERYSLVEIYQTRQCLESKAVELAAINATDDDLIALQEAYDSMCERFNRNNNTTGEFEMHKLYAAMSKNRFLEQLIEIAHKTAYDFMSSSFRDILFQHTIADSMIDHREIIRAIRSRDGERAKVIMASHMQHTIDMIKINLD